MIPMERLNKILDRYDECLSLISADFSSPDDYAKLSRERAELEGIIPLVKRYKWLCAAIADTEQLLSASDRDPEVVAIAEEDLDSYKEELEELKLKVQLALLPKDVNDDKNVIMEVRAGTGGEEAALFAADLVRMYNRYAQNHGWKFEIINSASTGLDGYKEVFINISGTGVFRHLKYESGVHRVQRIPDTESSGRIHTSAATVAVLPEAVELDIKIDEADLRIDVFRSSGAGGQHVNTTDSAVRITHIPSGIVVSQQTEKSQHQNKAKAMKILRSRLYAIEQEKVNAERSDMRKSQVGSGDRSERIRTYNFPQGRITDHRINMTIYNLAAVLEEGKLDDLISALISDDEMKRLAAET